MDIKKNIILVIAGVAVGLILFGGFPLYILGPTQQVVITQFGDPIQAISEPGLYLHIPGLQKIHYLDRRVLNYDSAATDIITKDKKNLLVDNYAKWKITDPLKFLQTVITEAGAQSRLDDIIYSELRAEMGRHDLIDIVAKKRPAIMAVVTERANEKAKEYGIEVLDVRIKRADLPAQNTQSVYDRMKAERHRIAMKYRSEGAEAATKIRAETDKERAIILSQAYKEKQIIMGEGDAVATRIYAEAYKKDPEFYAFIRSLDAYKKALKDKTTVVLTPQSEFMKHFNK
ncbi:MAG: protease modulator HflC [Nitrospinota bacterium]